MTEVDGAVAGDFFTVLCVGQSYTEDQWMNMYTFSMIKSWLLTYDTDGSSNAEAGNKTNRDVPGVPRLVLKLVSCADASQVGICA